MKQVRFQIDDEVLLKNEQETNKLLPKWKGPYTVHEEIGKGAYKLKDSEGKVLKASQNVKRLKKYYTRSHGKSCENEQ